MLNLPLEKSKGPWKKGKKLLNEINELREKIKNSTFIDPKDYRKLQELESLLITQGQTKDLKWKVGKPRKSKRVTSFNRNRS